MKRMITYRCTCQHGWTRCYRAVSKRGEKCWVCVDYKLGDGTHRDGYHADNELPDDSMAAYARAAARLAADTPNDKDE